jgi:hypothetical protein
VLELVLEGIGVGVELVVEGAGLGAEVVLLQVGLRFCVVLGGVLEVLVLGDPSLVFSGLGEVVLGLGLIPLFPFPLVACASELTLKPLGLLLDFVPSKIFVVILLNHEESEGV